MIKYEEFAVKNHIYSKLIRIRKKKDMSTENAKFVTFKRLHFLQQVDVSLANRTAFRSLLFFVKKINTQIE